MNAAAERLGLAPGMALADARALVPALAVVPHDGDADARLLGQIADWCGRFTPWTAVDGERAGGSGGVWLDVTGCAHLFGGEAALLADLLARVRLQGFDASAALAATPGTAWAAARFTPARGAALAGIAVPNGQETKLLADLPPLALRLDPTTADGLVRLGIRRIADLLALPRAGVAERFGPQVALRLDQALGRAPEPLSPRRPVAPLQARLAFAEPIAHPDDLARGLDALLADICTQLDRDGQGARRVELAAYRVDGAVQRIAVGTSRPLRRPEPLARLFAEHLGRIDPGFGIETLTLAAPVAEPLAPQALPLDPGFAPDMPTDAASAMAMAMQRAAGGPRGTSRPGEAAARPALDGFAAEVVELADRLANRLGPERIRRLVPRAAHQPEAAAVTRPFSAPPAAVPRLAPVLAPVLPAAARDPAQLRPLRLLVRPEAVVAVAVLPDRPPVMFRWGDRVLRVRLADGPERIAPDWWLPAALPVAVGAESLAPSMASAADAPARDYYRVETLDGARYWLYREGMAAGPQGEPRGEQRARWFLHGVFA